MEKTGVLLINLGTPLSYKPKDVRVYLNEFLLDPRVIDLPFLTRHLLVKGIIIPLRYRQSAKSYKEIWTEEGAPLLKYTQKTKTKLQTLMGDEFVIEMGMRYQEPSIEQGLINLQKHALKSLVVIPLFPQYASATTGSIYEKLFKILSKWNVIPKLKVIDSFYNHPKLIEAFTSIANSYDINSYDHILMSFHGLPERHIKKADPHKCCLASSDCCQNMSFKNKQCYSAQCHATAKSIAASLNLNQDRYTICFQSRLGKDPWLGPSTADIIQKLPGQGHKKVLVMCPAFACDCLETLHEIGIEYQHLFQASGGKNLTLMEGLNEHPLWIETLKELIFS